MMIMRLDSSGVGGVVLLHSNHLSERFLAMGGDC